MKIVRLPELITITGLARSTIYKHISEGTFPKPVPLSSRSVGWIDEEIDQWLQRALEKRNTNRN